MILMIDNDGQVDFEFALNKFDLSVIIVGNDGDG